MVELSPAGDILLVNRELCRIVGRPAEALLQSNIGDVSPPEELGPFREALERVSSGVEERGTIEHRLVSPAGGVIWLACVLTRLDGGGPGSVLVVVEDITAQKEAEQALGVAQRRREHLARERQAEEQARRESDDRLQFALDAARMGTWSWRPHEDEVTLDDTALRILGGGQESDFSFARALERNFPAESAERYLECVRRIMQPDAPEEAFEVELNWIRPDGAPIWIQMTGHGRSEGAGAERRIKELSGTLVDITERKRNEEALAEASRQKDRFIAMLAHELRNPLAPLSYAVELLRDNLQPELDWSRGVIERQVKHLARLIDDLLDVSRIHRDRLAVRRERISINDVVHAAVESSLQTLQAASQELDVEMPPQPVFVDGDFVRLTQVLTNLLENAAKFSPEPGRVRLGVERAGDEVLIRVRDSGAGIDLGALPHIFEPFYQSDDSAARMRGGLGIGLYLVRRLIELHGGTVEARNLQGEPGSEFIVRLPALAEPLRDAGAPQTAPAARAPRGVKARVLVVDDNRDSADALAKLLQVSGREVDVQYDGAAAIEAAKRFRPDVLLLDLGMPSVDGYEVCREIRRKPWGEDMHIVALTGWGRPEDRERTRAAGFDEHIVKPVDLGTIEAVLGRFAAPEPGTRDQP